MQVAIKFTSAYTFLIYPNRDLSAKPLTVQTLLDFSRMTAAASRSVRGWHRLFTLELVK